MRPVAPATPTTAGMPYSRATTAPCDIIPPISITSAPAVRKSGVHPGSVDGATRTSPGSSRAPTGDRMTCAVPRAIPGPDGRCDTRHAGISGYRARDRNFGLRVRAVGEKHARYVAAALLAPIERVAL